MDTWYGISSIVLFCIVINLPFGMWRSGCRKFSLKWFVAVHAPVPLVIAVRLLLDVPSIYIPLFIAAAIGGQFIGGKMKRIRSEEQIMRSEE